MKRIKVAFIAHPLNLHTLSILSGWPRSALDLFGAGMVRRYLERKKPFIFNRMPNLESKTGAEIDLVGVACPLLPDQMASLGNDFVLTRIVESVQLAKKEGADIAVLGGFTSVIGNEGEDVAKAVNIPVTSGNTFTAGLAIDGVETAMNLLGVSKIEKCTVIGATGDIGKACARYFAGRTKHLACVAREEEKLQKLAEQLNIGRDVRVTWHKKVGEGVKDADIIISATSALTTIIDSESLKPGAVVCDVALPANIAREVARKRRDVLVFEGGLSKVPFINKIKDQKWSNLMPTNAIYGCLAEGLILGFEGRIESFSIGRGNITNEKIMTIMQLASKHGFEASDYFCGDTFYRPDDIAFIKQTFIKTKDTARSLEGAII